MKYMKMLGLASVAVMALVAVSSAALAAEFEKYAVESASVELSTAQAGAHADLTISFELTQEKWEPFALTRDIKINLPPGLIGNPQAIPKCTTLQFGKTPEESECPQDAQVGVNEVVLGGVNTGTFLEPIYSMPSPGGDVVARLGFYAGPYPTFANVRVDPVDYSLVTTVEGAAAAAYLVGASARLWGVPAAPSNDPLRLTPEEALKNEIPAGGRKSGLP